MSARWPRIRLGVLVVGIPCRFLPVRQSATVVSLSDLYLSWSTPHSDDGMSARGLR